MLQPREAAYLEARRRDPGAEVRSAERPQRMVAQAAAKPALASATLAELTRVIAAAGQSAYRAKQVFSWVQRRNVLDPRLMSDLPAAFREQLCKACETAELSLVEQAKSADGSLKYCWLTVAGDPVEAVLMPGFDYGCRGLPLQPQRLPAGLQVLRHGAHGPARQALRRRDHAAAQPGAAPKRPSSQTAPCSWAWASRCSTCRRSRAVSSCYPTRPGAAGRRGASRSARSACSNRWSRRRAACRA